MPDKDSYFTSLQDLPDADSIVSEPLVSKSHLQVSSDHSFPSVMDDGDIVVQGKKSPSYLRKMMGWGGALLGVLILWESMSFGLAAWQLHPIAGGVVGLGLTSMLALCGKQLWLMRRERTTLDGRDNVKQKIQAIWLERSYGQFSKLEKSLVKLNPSLGQFLASQTRDDFKDDRELVAWLETHYCLPRDQQAMACITRHSQQIGLMVAVSPLAIVDMALALWRTHNMVNEIAGIYDIRPSMIGRFRLFSNVCKQLAFIGASELISDYMVQLSSQKLLASVSGRISQGVGAGLYSGRVGIKAMEVCRPLPFNALEKPTSKKLLISVKDYLLDKNLKNEE